MVGKYIKTLIMVIICVVIVWFFFAATNVKLTAKVMREKEQISVEYEVKNKSITPITLYKESQNEPYVEVLFYDSNKKLMKKEITEVEYSLSKGEIKAGESYHSTFYFEETSNLKAAKYIRLKLRVDKKYIENKSEKNLIFFRKENIYSKYIIIE
ncbi:MAG: hypothetical protein RR751_06370 [Clostridia bacterium]